MVLEVARSPLVERKMARPVPQESQVLVQVLACAVCRTDLHIVDGELPDPKLPLVLGHEIVGRVVARGPRATRFMLGQRIGIPWLGWTCGRCAFCLSGRENLCEQPRFTGYTIDGGYAQFTVADERFCFAIPDRYSELEAAPLLCAGLIGFRSFLKAGAAQRIGIYGFGAAGHLLVQVAAAQGRELYIFTRPGDLSGQKFATRLGARWTGGSDQLPPEKLDAAILFAPVGALIPQALKALNKGGVVVCGGIHMSDIPSFAYELLWEERSVTSVANLTRQDGDAFLALAQKISLKVAVESFPMRAANEALRRLRQGELEGAAVLIPDW